MAHDRKRQKTDTVTNTVQSGLALDYSSSSESESESENVNESVNETEHSEIQVNDNSVDLNIISETDHKVINNDLENLKDLEQKNEDEYGDDDDDDDADDGLNLSDLDSDNYSDFHNDNDINGDDDGDGKTVIGIKNINKYSKYLEKSPEWIFLNMLDHIKPKISPFSTYDLEVSQFIDTPQFFEIENDDLKKDLFDYWCSVNGTQDESKGGESGSEEISQSDDDDDAEEEEEDGQGIIELINYLKENQDSLPKYYFDFKRKFKIDLKELEIYKDNSNQRLIESIYKKFINFTKKIRKTNNNENGNDDDLIEFYKNLLIPKIKSYSKLNLQSNDLQKIIKLDSGFKIFKKVGKLGIHLRSEFIEFLFLSSGSVDDQIMKEVMLWLLDKLTKN